MSWLSNGWDHVTQAVDKVGDGAEHLLSDGEKLAGEAVDNVSGDAAKLLDKVGLHSLADDFESFGEQAADHLGADVPEKDLGQSDDPKELIHGDVGALNEVVGHLGKFSDGFGKTGGALRSIDVGDWHGEGGDAFHESYPKHPNQWTTAASAMTDARGALEDYARTVQWAQSKAAEAIALYDQGKRAGEQARNAYNQQVGAYNMAAAAYNASGGRGVRPTQPAAFVDPGVEMIAQARATLKAARSQRDESSGRAASALAAATAQAPKTPSFAHRMLDDGADLMQAGSMGAQHIGGGALGAIGDFVKMARALDPQDPYNVTHPAAYSEGLRAFGSGLAHMATHPAELGKAVIGAGWTSDPFAAVGALLPQVAAAGLTGGGSEAGVVAADAAGRAAVSGAEHAVIDGGGRAAVNAGEGAARQAAADTREVARLPESKECPGDPVDVATGAVTLTQTDVELDAVLPLRLERTYVSTYGAGRWFGPGWASTLDERLEIDAEGIVFAAENAMLLSYRHPGPNEEVLPAEGPRWPLTRGEDGTYRVRDPRTGRCRHFRSASPAGVAPVVTVPITAVTDRNSNRILFRYDAFGSLKEVRHSGGYRVLVATDGGRITGLRLATPTERSPEETTSLIDFGYTEGRLTQVVNSSGMPLEFGYDSDGRFTNWSDRNGTDFRYDYDESGRCVHQTGPGGIMEATFDYRPVDVENPARGMVTTMTDGAGSAVEYRINRARQVVAITDARGGRTSSTFDRFDRLLSRTDALGHITRYTYDVSGDVIEVVRPDGARVTARYDGVGRQSRLREADGAEWSFEYDAFGNRVATQAPDRTRTTVERGPSGAVSAVIDELGNRTEIECDAAGLPIAVTDSLHATTRYLRDAFGRVAQIVAPDGETTYLEWTVEGKISSRTAPDGGREVWRYDAEGNLVEHMDAVGAVTRTEYTHFDLPSAQVGPDGARTEYAYDPVLRLTSVTNPQGLEWAYRYDKVGRLTSETDFAGAVHRYGYDLAGRVETRSVGESVVGYRYDVLGNLVEESGVDGVTRYAYDVAGRMSSAVGPGAEVRFERDRLGRVVAEVCDGRRLEVEYDPAGRRLGRTTPGGTQTRWRRDAAGRIVQIDCGGRQLMSARDSSGRETSRTLGPGLSLDQRWRAGRLAQQSVVAGRSVLNMGGGASSGQLLAARQYEYRVDGALSRVEDQLRGPRSFALDNVGRVTSVVGDAWREDYGYDVAGNMTGALVPESVGGSPERTDAEYRGVLLTRSGRTRFQHDDRGRVAGKTVTRLSRKPEQWKYLWDMHDRLRELVTPDGSVWRYRYDAFGRRVAKVRLGAEGEVLSETLFTWDGDRLVEQSDGERITTWDYDGDGFTPVAQSARLVDQAEVDAEFYAIVTDVVGSPAELIDPTRGEIAGRAVSSLWGRTVWSGDASTPLRFPGQYHDDESGLHYNRHRYYQPGTGRYLTLDPLGLAPAPNPVTYPHNPTGWVDPLGLAPGSCGGGSHVPSRHEAFNQAKRDAGIPRTQQPSAVVNREMTDMNGRRILGENGLPINTREYQFLRGDGQTIVIQDHGAGHKFGEGGIGDQGPHFNVRPFGRERHGSVPGTLDHYPFGGSG